MKNKIIIIFGLVTILVGCSYKINEKTYEMAQNVCKDYGGLLLINVYQTTVTVECNSKVEFNFYKVQ